jgi:hypothetical protein
MVEVRRGVRRERMEVLVKGERTVDAQGVAVGIEIVEIDHPVAEP